MCIIKLHGLLPDSTLMQVLTDHQMFLCRCLLHVLSVTNVCRLIRGWPGTASATAPTSQGRCCSGGSHHRSWQQAEEAPGAADDAAAAGYASDQAVGWTAAVVPDLPGRGRLVLSTNTAQHVLGKAPCWSTFLLSSAALLKCACTVQQVLHAQFLQCSCSRAHGGVTGSCNMAL